MLLKDTLAAALPPGQKGPGWKGEQPSSPEPRRAKGRVNQNGSDGVQASRHGIPASRLGWRTARRGLAHYLLLPTPPTYPNPGQIGFSRILPCADAQAGPQQTSPQEWKEYRGYQPTCRIHRGGVCFAHCALLRALFSHVTFFSRSLPGS